MQLSYRAASPLRGPRSLATLVSVVLLLVLPMWTQLAFGYTPPPQTGWVNDPGKLLSDQERTFLAKKLETHQRAKGHQIVVFVLRTLGGESVEDVAYGAFNTWKIGDPQRDDGVLLLIAVEDRTARIETGKGVGGEIPDLEASRILSTAVTPNMRANDLPQALDDATSLIITKLGGQAPAVKARQTSAPSSQAKPAENDWFSKLPLPLKILVVIIVIILWLRFGWTPGGRSGGGGSSFFGGGGSSGGGGASEKW